MTPLNSPTNYIFVGHTRCWALEFGRPLGQLLYYCAAVVIDVLKKHTHIFSGFLKNTLKILSKLVQMLLDLQCVIFLQTYYMLKIA